MTSGWKAEAAHAEDAALPMWVQGEAVQRQACQPPPPPALAWPAVQ